MIALPWLHVHRARHIEGKGERHGPRQTTVEALEAENKNGTGAATMDCKNCT